ncbi:hypothetical protein [Sphaerotilus sp.]|uniref:hypothetical protein n=1 Tax=Sphaerotilus sp. TaxID=2093942 RepID=UPI002ACE489A|nr:hypothetical protein [Sphaerotilus sp.]MDZ7855941.1 hypothetical protein [Sphaerotilus sp.]
MARLLVPVLALWVAIGAHAQPASAPVSTPTAGEIPMADYLGLLAQISPAAREGTELYLQAVERHCRRSLTTAELRRAMSDGSGDPVLMGLIRASQLRDAKAMAELGQRIECGGRR